MCTAVSYKTRDHYFGRNLDLEYTYDEKITITPRRFALDFRHAGTLHNHYAMIGVATVAQGYPLYYDATNEKGLSIAGLNFPDNAYYNPPANSADNIASFELTPWLLGKCATVAQARALLNRINIVNTAFSESFPPSPLHWLLSDKYESITIESTKEGLRVYDNPVGVLTNNPPFDYQLLHLSDYMCLSCEPAVDRFAGDDMHLSRPYSRGMGAIGLPGDLSSASRFVRAAFTKLNSVCDGSDNESISQFFHILGSVEQQRGCVQLLDARYEITVYSSCCNTDRGVYCYRTYDSHRISAVDMHRENLDSNKLIIYPLISQLRIDMQN